MTSPAQLRANRTNARKSTGPRSPAGKAVSAGNATKHGLCSTRLRALAPGESEAELDRFRAAFLVEFAPEGALETFYAERACWAAWRLARIPGLEAAVLDAARLEVAREDASAALADGIERFRLESEREFGRALVEQTANPRSLALAARDQLVAQGRARAVEEGGDAGTDGEILGSFGFVSPALKAAAAALACLDRAETDRQRAEIAMGRAFAVVAREGSLATLCRYEQDLGRELERSIAQLERLQRLRRAGVRRI